jgi:ribose 5-phosphate isomerase B
MPEMTLAIGGDHAGYELKKKLTEHLRAEGFTVLDVGADGPESSDYPEYAHAVARAVQEEEASLGVLVCGSGNGMNMAANKHKGIRAALAWNEDIAALARTHNDANVLTLPARFIPETEALKIVDRFLAAAFEGGRHARRVNKIEMDA